ncbi:hypothetical protein QN277_023777 [Acacia crassicarpa]|uniref:RNase H type-1 domain-containing protein n=1 Tax=Acacia crassicarpa TaxID=499986 RepID=A0AAE1MIV3_9FABA|nr:hypothetical protein QN277_023777 [Acacia crassicarpa]
MDCMRAEGMSSDKSELPCVHWLPPESGLVKINTDGDFSSEKVPAVIGVVCRDHLGFLQWGYVDKVKSISAFMTEALALKRALLLAVDIGIDNAIFESNCLSLISYSNAKSPDMIKWRSRTNAFKEVCSIGWIQQPTPSLSSLLTLDAQEASIIRNADLSSCSVLEGT